MLKVGVVDRSTEYGGQFVRWLLTTRDTPYALKAEAYRIQFPYPQGRHCQHAYDCCANWYESGLDIRLVGDRVLIKQALIQNV